MNRLGLRLATVASLQNGGNMPFPTMANERVYDSRKPNWTDIRADDRWPCISVMTDTDLRDSTGDGRATVNHVVQRRCELRIGFAIWTVQRDEQGELEVGWSETDPELEAMLDLFEFQMECALFGSSPWAQFWRSLGIERETMTSAPIFLTAEEGRVKLAARELLLNLRILPDCIPRARHHDDPIQVPALPDRLIEVFDFIAKYGAGEMKEYAQQLRTMLENRELPVGSVYPLLERVRSFWLENKTPPGHRPRVDIQAEWLDKLQR